MLLILVDCGSVSIANKRYSIKNEKLQLGQIGIKGYEGINKNVTSIGSINPETPIPVTVHKLDGQQFRKGFITNLLKANGEKHDSLNTDRFFKLEITDKLALIQLLNEPKNNNREFLKNNRDAFIVTSIVMSDKEIGSAFLENSETILFTRIDRLNNGLKFYSRDSLVDALPMNNIAVYATRASRPCWKEDDHRKIKIVDLVDTSRDCPDGSFEHFDRTKRKINYFKL